MKRTLYATIFVLPLLISQLLLAQSNGDTPAETRSRIGNFNGPSESPFSIFPLPSTGTITIAFTDAQSQAPDVEVYDLLGNRIALIHSVSASETNFMVDLSDKKPGYYFLKIQSEGKVFTRRITIRP